MAESKLNDLWIKKDDMLVTFLPDYYTAKKTGGFDTHTPESVSYDTGIIEKVGEDLPQEWVGKIIHYTRDVSPTLRIKGVGVYLKVNEEAILTVRLDQNRTNFNL